METTTTPRRKEQVFRVPPARIVPNRVREFRVNMEMSASKCARAIGVSRAAIYHAEVRNCGLSIDHWIALADLLQTDVKTIRSSVTP